MKCPDSAKRAEKVLTAQARKNTYLDMRYMDILKNDSRDIKF